MAEEGTVDPRTTAAIIATVQAYLDQEAHLSDRGGAGRISRWRLAVRQDSGAPKHGGHGSWSGRR